MNRQLLLVVAAALVALLAVAGNSVYGSEEELTEIQKALEAKGNPWTAAMNPKSELPAEVRSGLNGLLVPSDSGDERVKRDRPRFHPLDLPNHWDWRDVGGANYVTPIRDQGNTCGSCWDFAATGITESGVLIYHDKPGRDYDLSEQHILSCSGAGDCDGGYVEYTLDYYISDGSPDEPCFPYEADDTLPCSDTCSDWASRAQRINGWSYVTDYGDNDTDTIKAAVYEYPVAAGMDVYYDFYYYSSGIYEYTYGSRQGPHAVVIVGWDDDQEYWIAKNSWDTTWGENGFFRIKWGEVEFGDPSWAQEPSDTMTYIDLDSFDAEVEGSNVLLTWDTGAEIDNAGFLIYRTIGDGNFELISDLIPARGTPSAGASYTFLDTDVSRGVEYCYYLVDIDTSGTWAAHGPACAKVDFTRLLPMLTTAKEGAIVK